MNTISKISAACALVCAGVATQAQATPASAFAAPDLTIYLSGASAPQNFISGLSGQLFDGAFFTYYDNGGTPGTTTISDDGAGYRSFFGTMKTTTDIPLALRGKNVLITDRAKGGSVWGVNAVARSEAIQTMPITAVNCPDFDAGNNRFLCNAKGIDPGLGAPTGDEVIPDFGVSDVEPALFKDPLNVEFGQTQLSIAEAARLVAFPANSLMMGLPVTNAVGDFFISRAAYGSALTGIVTNWSALGTTAPATSDSIVVCRRVPGSGTQAAYNWYFANFPCGASATPATQGDTASILSGAGTSADPFLVDATAGYLVIENAGSGDVRNCLAKANNGGVHSWKDGAGQSYKVDFGTGGYGALGVLSVDSLGKESGWTYRTFDGAGHLDAGLQTVTGTGLAPTKANLVAGNYEFAVELSFQYRKTGAPNALAGMKKTFADLFIARAGQSSFNTRNWVAGLPGTVNACGSANTTKAFRAGDTCGNYTRVCN